MISTKIAQRDLWIIAIALSIGLFLGWLIFHSPVPLPPHQPEEQKLGQEVVYTCAMHPQIRQKQTGLCPICAMDLVPLPPLLSQDDQVAPNALQMDATSLALASVQTTIVKRGIPKKDLYLLGKVKADERYTSQLTARFGGRIEKLFINYIGQKVKKGEKLGTVYSPELITAQKELLEAGKYKTSNPTFYKVARTKLRLWNISEQQITTIENSGKPIIHLPIYSTIGGTITKKHIAIGDYVKEGSPLFEVIDLSRIWVVFDAYESDLGWITKGDSILFSTQSNPGKQYQAKITYIAPFINAQTRVAQVRVELNNPNQKLKPEMFTRGVLKSRVSASTDELLVPQSAILWTGKRAIVYVKIPEREGVSFIYRDIELGPQAGSYYVVKSGLSEGEEVATNGVFKIDAAAQLAGKTSMMNPNGLKLASDRVHGEMEMKNKEKNPQALRNNPLITHEKIKVSGNCEMCQSTIENTARNLPGVIKANWDLNSKELHLAFYNNKVSLKEIHFTIAKAGYDTEQATAPQEVYDNLPPCCQYTRASSKAQHANLLHEEFKVAGNCNMCKNTIEKTTLSLSGVNSAQWNSTTKMLQVTFNSDKITLREIHKSIANVGYDTQLEKAPIEVYNQLPGCCQYTRE